VIKKRKEGRVVSIETAIVFGDPEEVKKHLVASPTSKNINTSFVERNNSTMRQNSRRLARRGNGFSKELCKLESQLYLASVITILLKHICALGRKFLMALKNGAKEPLLLRLKLLIIPGLPGNFWSIEFRNFQ
jgi:hypothetical protein